MNNIQELHSDTSMRLQGHQKDTLSFKNNMKKAGSQKEITLAFIYLIKINVCWRKIENEQRMRKIISIAEFFTL